MLVRKMKVKKKKNEKEIDLIDIYKKHTHNQLDKKTKLSQLVSSSKPIPNFKIYCLFYLYWKGDKIIKGEGWRCIAKWSKSTKN